MMKKIGIALLPMLIVFLVNLCFMYLNLYWYLWWLDMVMHIMGGSVTAFTMILLMSDCKHPMALWKKSPGFFFLFLLGLVALVGIGWELYEFIHDLFFPVSIQMSVGVRDTLEDLVSDLIGGSLFYLLFSLTSEKKKSRRLGERLRRLV